MIEVEKKFTLSQADIDRLKKLAQPVSQKVFTDTYYDTADFSLTITDRWLRRRDKQFELKLPLHHGADRLADQYEELADEPKIITALQLDPQRTLMNTLAQQGYKPFGAITTTRQKFKHGPFTIDLDSVIIGSEPYTVGEIELLVETETAIQPAVEKIITFAEAQKLTVGPVRGKIIEYIKRSNPDHYAALVAAGVVKDF